MSEESDILSVFEALYEQEINCGISSFWDGGFTVWIGDDMNGRKAEATFYPPDLGGAAAWLMRKAGEIFPPPTE